MNSTETTHESNPPAPQEPPAPELPSPRETLEAERVEKVRKIYVRDLQLKERVQTVFLVTKKTRQVSRNGKPFLVLTLSDRTGDVDARIFDRAEEYESKFLQNDYLLVEGQVISFHGKPQVVVETLDRLEPEPIDAREFIAPPAIEDSKSPVAQIKEMVDRVQDPHVRALLQAFLEDRQVAEGLRYAPAAKGIHHAYRGGLADHILSVVKLAHRMADHYPMADRDLLVAGAMLHDIGKVTELSYEKNFDYTDEGKLIGHLVMTAQKIREKASRLPHFPPLLEHHITHLVLSHHGHLEFGSPKLPMTLEAFIVHIIDHLDSRVASWLELMAKDPNEKWADATRLYDRQIWKGVVPTQRGRSPLTGRVGTKKEGNERRRFRVFTPHAGSPNAATSENAGSAAGKAEEPSEKKSLPEVAPSERLTFKPLNELTEQLSSHGNDDPSAAPAEPTKPSES
jgi:3'-5' exoribonuclease